MDQGVCDRKRVNVWLLLIVLLLVTPAWGGTTPLPVAASIFPLADVVRQVGGERVRVLTILPPGASEHTFEPTPSQLRQASTARLYVRVGAGLDPWSDKLMAGNMVRRVTATDGIALLPVTAEEDAADHHQESGGGDPHVWLDPILVRDHLLPALVKALSELQPTDAPFFRANAERFSRQLTLLDADYRRTIATFSQKEFIAMHSAWGYMAKRYGLRQVAAIEPSPGKEPSPRFLVSIVRLARSHRVTTIFAEPQLSAKSAQVIAAEINGQVLLLDPIGGEGVAGRDGYIPLMRYNLQVMSGGMRQ
jgi:zinc transport system substrate-binding protein